MFAVTSAKRLYKPKSTAQNPPQSAAIRISASHLLSQNTWADIVDCSFDSLNRKLQNAICPRARARGGGCASKPKWFRIFSIAWRCRIAAMILNSPPQCAQWVKSTLNTRFNSLAQPKRIGRPCSGGSWSLVAATGERWASDVTT